MRRRVRQSSPEPRFEMAPLLDVIFLLLTFFIYTIVLTVRAEVMPVSLPTISTAEAPEDAEIAAITVDGQGRFYLNRERIERPALRDTLNRYAGRDAEDRPQIFVALATEDGPVDRGPLFIELIDMLRQVGLKDFHVVGREKRGGAGGGSGGGSGGGDAGAGSGATTPGGGGN